MSNKMANSSASPWGEMGLPERAFKSYRNASLIERIKNDLRDTITSGGLKPGERLPSEPELAATLGVSRNSLREAIGLLENEGLLYRRQGVGTFITASGPVIRGGIERLRSIADFITEQGYEAGNTITRFEAGPCDELVAGKLLIAPADAVTVLETIKLASGEPVALCLDVMPSSLLAGGADPEAMKGSIFDYLRQRHGIDILYAEAELVPTVADRALAAKLATPQGRPVLLLESVHFDVEGARVLFSRSYFPAGKFAFKLIRRH
jgi:GntR family transcriptional regulator